MKYLAINRDVNLEDQKLIFFNYDSPLELSNSKIIGFVGNKPNSINENYIFSLASTISDLVKGKNYQKILINSSSNNFGIAFSSIFYNALAADPNKEILIFEEKFGYSQSLARHYFINNDFDFFINIEVNLSNKNLNLTVLTFYKKNLTLLTAEEEKKINKTEQKPFFYRSSQIYLTPKFHINSDHVLKFYSYFDLDFYKLANFYQFYDSESTFLTNFLKDHFDTEKSKFLPIKKSFPIEKITRQVSDNSIIWKKITTSAKFMTNVIFWVKKNKIITAVRKKLNFNIIKDNDFQLLVLDFLERNWKNGKYFLISHQANNYISEFIEQKFGAKITKFCEYNENSETELLKIREKTNDEVVVITSKSVHFVPKVSENSIKYGISTKFSILWYVKIFEFYTQNNLNIFEIIQKMKNELNFVFQYKYRMKATPSTFDKIVNLLVNENDTQFRPQGYNISNSDSGKHSIKLKVNLQNNDFYTLIYFKPKEELTLYTNFLSKNHTEKEAVFLENLLIDKVKLANKNLVSSKNNKAKDFIKFGIFITTIIVILILLFYNFYNSSFADGSPTKIFVKFYEFFFKSRVNRLVLLGAIAHFLFWNLTSTLQLRRIFKYQKVKTRFRHLFIATFIATFMQFSTPFSFGGEISYYWYLQKKKYPLKNISATLTYNALIHQVFNLVVSLILIPVGFIYYRDLFILDSWEKIIFFAWLVVNIFLNVLVLLIIIIISVWKKLQYLLIKLFVSLLNLNFLKKIEDRQRLEYRFQFLIDNFKNHFMEVLSNKKLLAKILLLYKLPVFFINFSFVILIITLKEQGLDLSNINFHDYLKFISGFTLLQISNNLSPSPGGVGSADLITKLIFKSFFDEANSLNLDIFNFTNRIYTWFLPYLLSAIGILTVWVGEKRVDRYKEIQNTMQENLILNYKLKKQDSHIFFYALSFWAIVATGILIFVFAI
ncbi:lysylphosphatidylglycerol synthase transmembrane domain-containing protein [Mesomycoplasma ovipneumoniae]|uniref:lysylphosphatidylglycerol synthase transmembrane domain-containing protein n=1 Tax=Mesomycoplasma ovipneumoniae TaxID=29562 RepID=UPI00311AEC66